MTPTNTPETLEAWAADIEAGRQVWIPAQSLRKVAAELRRLHEHGPTMVRGKNGDGSDWIGTMREVMGDYQEAASVEAREGDRLRAEVEKLRQAQGGEARPENTTIRKSEWDGLSAAAQERIRASIERNSKNNAEGRERLLHKPLSSPPLQADACKVPQGWKLINEVELRGIVRSIRQHIEQGVASEAFQVERNPSGGTGIYTYLEHRMDEISAMLSAAPTQVETQWQSIETAPKDGSEVLVMYMHIDTQIVHNAFFAAEEDGWDAKDVGWWSYEHSEVSRIKLDQWMTPTHWMPLPAAPSTPPSC